MWRFVDGQMPWKITKSLHCAFLLIFHFPNPFLYILLPCLDCTHLCIYHLGQPLCSWGSGLPCLNGYAIINVLTSKALQDSCLFLQVSRPELFFSQGKRRYFEKWNVYFFPQKNKNVQLRFEKKHFWDSFSKIAPALKRKTGYCSWVSSCDFKTSISSNTTHPILFCIPEFLPHRQKKKVFCSSWLILTNSLEEHRSLP